MSLGSHETYLPAAVPPVAVRRFTVEEYQRLGELGILTEDDNVELIEGWIVPKMTKNPPHDAAVALMVKAISRLALVSCHIRVQSVVALADSQPEPDIAIVVGDERRYGSAHPGPADVALVVEVADTSLDRDRGLKLQMYARSQIEPYWVLNLIDQQLEVYSVPLVTTDDARYQTKKVYRASQSVPLELLGQMLGHLKVSELLP